MCLPSPLEVLLSTPEVGQLRSVPLAPRRGFVAGPCTGRDNDVLVCAGVQSPVRAAGRSTFGSRRTRDTANHHLLQKTARANSRVSLRIFPLCSSFETGVPDHSGASRWPAGRGLLGTRGQKGARELKGGGFAPAGKCWGLHLLDLWPLGLCPELQVGPRGRRREEWLECGNR